MISYTDLGAIPRKSSLKTREKISKQGRQRLHTVGEMYFTELVQPR
jgi:hypothetical protein